MSIRSYTPCDEVDPIDGLHHCPYAVDGDYVNCEWYCGADEPEDNPEEWEPDYEDEVGFDPYEGCYTYDC